VSCSLASYGFPAGNKRDVAGALTTFTWDQENRLISANVPGVGASSGLTTFLYTDDGKKLATIAPSGTTQFVWDEDVILQETNASGVTQAQYGQGPGDYGLLVSQKRGSTVQFYGSDDRDNVILLLTQGGGTGYYDYTAFGTVLVSNASINPFQFAGNVGVYEELAALLGRSGARIYDPVTGRWISMDPIGFDGGDMNLYAYVSNNPVLWVDPSGWQPVMDPPVRALPGNPSPVTSPSPTPTQPVVPIAPVRVPNPILTMLGKIPPWVAPVVLKTSFCLHLEFGRAQRLGDDTLSPSQMGHPQPIRRPRRHYDPCTDGCTELWISYDEQTKDMVDCSGIFRKCVGPVEDAISDCKRKCESDCRDSSQKEAEWPSYDKKCNLSNFASAAALVKLLCGEDLDSNCFKGRQL
jgi:RHS repeat-associated protein